MRKIIMTVLSTGHNIYTLLRVCNFCRNITSVRALPYANYTKFTQFYTHFISHSL